MSETSADPLPTPQPSPSADLTFTPIEWVTPSTPLGGEASGFTPWLSKNLELVGAAIGMDDLELVATEVYVAGKRLDILAAIAADNDGSTTGIAIEAQYGSSDHDHLGKLVTYAAGAADTFDRVLAVWLVDEVHPAHQAAVELLNRETTHRLGFVLARVRFVSTGTSSWSVDVDVTAQPNEFLREQREKLKGKVHPERRQFLQEVLDIARQRVLDAGFRPASAPFGRGYSARITRPNDTRWRIDVRAGDATDNFQARVYVNSEATIEENDQILAKFRAHQDVVLDEVTGFPHEFDWHFHNSNNHAKVAALALCRWPGIGYESDPAVAAERLVSFCRGVAKAASAAGF